MRITQGAEEPTASLGLTQPDGSHGAWALLFALIAAFWKLSSQVAQPCERRIECYFKSMACLVKSVFRAPVPAYCLAQAFALSAQAVKNSKKQLMMKMTTRVLNLILIYFKIWVTLPLLKKTPTIFVNLLKFILFFKLLSHMQNT